MLSGAISSLAGSLVSRSEIQRILNNSQIRPHREKIWLHSPDPEFRDKTEKICDIYLSPPQDTHVICIDEKTGMQALERIHPSTPARSGKLPRIEFEYKRHGTQSLIASFDVNTGGVWGHCGETRTGHDLMEFMEEIALIYEGNVIIIWDNLNTHKGEKWEEFNKRHDNRFQFVYTPIHASWLNQIEIWFGTLQKRVISGASFLSDMELQKKVLDFIDYWNEYEAHPYKWAFIPIALKDRLSSLCSTMI